MEEDASSSRCLCGLLFISTGDGPELPVCSPSRVLLHPFNDEAPGAPDDSCFYFETLVRPSGSHVEIGIQLVFVSHTSAGVTTLVPHAEALAVLLSSAELLRFTYTVCGCGDGGAGLIQFTSSQFQFTLTQFNKRLFN